MDFYWLYIALMSRTYFHRLGIEINKKYNTPETKDMRKEIKKIYKHLCTCPHSVYREVTASRLLCIMIDINREHDRQKIDSMTK